MNCTIVHASKYDFTPDGTTDRLTGVKVTYLESAERSQNAKGRPVVIMSGAIDLWEKLVEVPGVYDIDVKLKMKSFGTTTKPVASLVSLDYLGEDSEE